MSEFDKIIGYTNEKEEMMRLCDVLKNKEKYIAFGVKIPKAVLLYGEPGLGKTLMAKAFITETGRKVFFCKKNKPDGEFVDKIKETFENAIKEAPSVIFSTIWTNLQKIICKETAIRKNLYPFRQVWKKSAIKMFLSLPRQTTQHICPIH